MHNNTPPIFFLLFLLALVLSACGNLSPQSEPAKSNTSQPAVQAATPGSAPTLIPEKEQAMATFTPIRGEQVMIETASPEQNAQGKWELRISGQLPTPCHEIKSRYTVENGNLNFEINASQKPDTMCAQVITDFEQIIPIPDLPAGDYKVFINGILIEEIHI